jgi:hypothetical protein
MTYKASLPGCVVAQTAWQLEFNLITWVTVSQGATNAVDAISAMAEGMKSPESSMAWRSL